MMRFEHDLGGGLTLALRTPDFADAMRELTMANIERLRQWEQWAHAFDPNDADDGWDREQLRRYVEGTAIPTVVLDAGQPVGAVSVRLDRYAGIGEFGYWIDAGAEGRGIAYRVCRALLTAMFADGVARAEIRTAVRNTRSVRLAEHLGFVREGVLRSAGCVGELRHDVAVYGLLPSDVG